MKKKSFSFSLIPLYRKMKWKKNRLIILLQAEKNLTHFMEVPFLGRITYTASLNQEHPNCAKDCNGKFVNFNAKSMQSKPIICLFFRFDFVMPPAVPKNNEKRYQVTSEDTSSSLAPSPAKRPMNGFMLFAQKYRLQLIQQFPGRDNR